MFSHKIRLNYSNSYCFKAASISVSESRLCVIFIQRLNVDVLHVQCELRLNLKCCSYSMYTSSRIMEDGNDDCLKYYFYIV